MESNRSTIREGRIKEEMQNLARNLFSDLDPELGYVMVQYASQQYTLNRIINGGIEAIFSFVEEKNVPDKVHFLNYILFQIYNINNIGLGYCPSDTYIFEQGVELQGKLNAKHGKTSVQQDSKLLSFDDLKNGRESQNFIERTSALRIIKTISMIDSMVFNMKISNTTETSLSQIFYMMYLNTNFLDTLKKNSNRRLNSTTNERKEEKISSGLTSILLSTSSNRDVNKFMKHVKF